VLAAPARPQARPPAPGFNSYFGSPGAVGSPTNFVYPQPGVYGGRVFNPFGTPGIPLSASTGATPFLPESWAGVALFDIRLPEGARFWINGQPTKQTGAVREFVTPTKLVPGVTYRYNFRAEWEENGRPVVRERAIDFQSASRTIVDFTRPDSPPDRDQGSGR
jgi:uncharacterized protein (TIGR03000 family)